FSLFRIFLDAKVIHWDKLNLICINQRWVNSFPVDEFAHLGQDLHTFVTKKKINESLPRIWMRGLVAEDGIMPISQHLSQPNVVYGCSFLSIGECINDIRDGYLCFSSHDTFSRWNKRFDKNRLHAGQIPNEFVRPFFTDNLVYACEPLGGCDVLGRIGHGDFSLELRPQNIF